MRKKTIKIIILILLSAILPFTVFAGIYLFREAPQPQQPPEPTHPVVDEPAEPTHPVVEVESIRIMLETDEMPIGTRFFPEVIILPQNATDKSFELNSDNLRVIRLQGHNWVAAEIGTANLIATAPNGVTATVEITVTAHDLETLSFEDDEITMLAGTQTDLSVIIYPRDAALEEPIRFSSNDDRIATVTTRGRIHAIDAGTAIVTARVGDILAELSVTVIAPDLEALAEEVFRLTNLERENAGLLPLVESRLVTEAALIRADEIMLGEVDYIRPDGSGFQTVLDEVGVTYALAGENIEAGQKSPAEVIRAWMDSEDERFNIFDEDFMYLGVGIAMDSDGRLYWTQMFVR
ncbi:MAG: Ig-like domain-containing protein [Oscillospiraceae bacterium]|nr:Ig-like domain-containing protein [Oscillospiraceae bacterium]